MTMYIISNTAIPNWDIILLRYLLNKKSPGNDNASFTKAKCNKEFVIDGTNTGFASGILKQEYQIIVAIKSININIDKTLRCRLLKIYPPN